MEKIASERDMLRSIDRDAYILKLKIASVLNKRFGADINLGNVENMHFVDILNSVSGDYDADELYRALKKAAGHGLTQKQKEFLYDHSFCIFTPYEWDFDDYLEHMRSSLSDEDVFNGTSVVVVPEYRADEIGPDLLCYHCRPLWLLEAFTLVPEEYPPSEAILLQNGYLMVIHTLHSLDDIEVVRTLKRLQERQPFQDDDDDDE